MNAPARLPSLPLTALWHALAIAFCALGPVPAAAQIETWSANGDVSMTYRIQAGGTVFGRNAAQIDDTIETDIISAIEVGGTSGAADDDPGNLFLSNAGDEAAPRNVGEVDVNVGTFSLNDSIVTGRIDLNRPGSSLTMLLSETRGSTVVVVRDGGLFTPQVSRVGGATVLEGGMARASGIIGSIGSVIGADVEIDASTLLSASFIGRYVLRDCTVTGPTGRFREGDLRGEATSVDVDGELTVGGATTSAVPTDTVLQMTSSVFESGTAVVRSGLSSGVVIDTDFEMRGASTWRSFGLFTITNETTHVDINSGSRIDARADFHIASAFATIGSGTATSSRIDVAGDFDLDGSLPSALTIEAGGVVDVDGTLTIGPLATLNLNGGTLRVGNLDNQGVLNENGGTLIVPEAAGVAPPLAAALMLVLLRRSRRAQRAERS